MRDWLTMIIAGSILAVVLVYLIVRAVFHRLRVIRRRRIRPEHVEKTATVMDAMMKLLDQQRTLSNEITDSLEKRAQELRGLIRQADETIARLAARVSTFSTPKAETEPEDADEEPLPEVGTDRAERAALFGSVRSVSPTEFPLPGSRLSSEDKQRLIYEYADLGMDIHEIAREMKIGKGEVKLVLSLRQGA